MKKVILPLIAAVLVIAAGCHDDDNPTPVDPSTPSIVGNWDIASALSVDGNNDTTLLTPLLDPSSEVDFSDTGWVHLNIVVNLGAGPAPVIDSLLQYTVLNDSTIQLIDSSAVPKDTTILPYHNLTDSSMDATFPLSEDNPVFIHLTR